MSQVNVNIKRLDPEVDTVQIERSGCSGTSADSEHLYSITHTGARHPRDPCRFPHGRVRVPQDARPAVGTGPGSGRDRPRPGDERHAGIGNPRRAPRQDARRHQTGEGHGRRARPRGTRVRGGGAEPARTWPTPPTCAWPTARSATRRSSPTCSPAASSDGHAPPPWTPRSCRCRRWNRRYHGPPRMAARTVSCTIPTMACSTSASCTPPGLGNSACFPRPARSATRTATPWPRASTARTGPSSSGGASPSGIRGTWNRRRSGGSRGGDSKHLHRSLAYRTPEAVGTEYYANQAVQAAPL